MFTREKWNCFKALEHYLNQKGIDLDSVAEEDIEMDESARVHVIGGTYVEGVKIVKGNMSYFTPLEEYDSDFIAFRPDFEMSGASCDTFTLEGKEYHVLLENNYKFGRENFGSIDTWKCYKALEHYFTQQNINLDNMYDVGISELKRLYLGYGKSLDLKGALITMKDLNERYELEYFVPLPEHNSEIEGNRSSIVMELETITIENVSYFVLVDKLEIEPEGDWWDRS